MAALAIDVDACIFLCTHLFQIFFKDIVIGDQLSPTLQWVKSTILRKCICSCWRYVEILWILWRSGNLVMQELYLPRIGESSRLKWRLLVSWKPSQKTSGRLHKIYKDTCVLTDYATEVCSPHLLGLKWCHNVSYINFILLSFLDFQIIM